MRQENGARARAKDRRGRMFFHPDRKTEQAEIVALYASGLHYIGDWHTHPTQYPMPSKVDIRNIEESVTQSTHQLNAFVLVIVGNATPPEGLYVSVNDGIEDIRLAAAD